MDNVERERREALRSQLYDPLRVQLDAFGEIVAEKPFGDLWFATMLEVRHYQKDVRRGLIKTPQIVEFANSLIPLVIGTLEPEVRTGPRVGVDIKQKAIVARGVLHKISNLLNSRETVEREPQEMFFLSFEELISMSDRFRIETKKDEQGEDRRYFSIYSPKRNKWFEYPVPNSDFVIHKGGMGRTILKILFGKDAELVESELPPHDFDYIAAKRAEASRDIKGLRADADGVEEVDRIDYPTLINDRDLTINIAFVGKNGLIFTQTAREAAESGKIAIVSEARGLWGSEKFFYGGEDEDPVLLIKNRGMMRLIKTLVENKAKSFDFLPLNRQVDLGIYWLVLAKRFYDMPDNTEFPLLLDRLFELGRKTGQVREGENNIYDALVRAHTKCPFFDFDKGKIDEEGVARWLGRKLIEQFDRTYRHKYKVPSLLDLTRENGDTVPYEVSLADYEADPKKLKRIKAGWKGFIRSCRKRTRKYVTENEGKTAREKRITTVDEQENQEESEGEMAITRD